MSRVYTFSAQTFCPKNTKPHFRRFKTPKMTSLFIAHAVPALWAISLVYRYGSLSPVCSTVVFTLQLPIGVAPIQHKVTWSACMNRVSQNTAHLRATTVAVYATTTLYTRQLFCLHGSQSQNRVCQLLCRKRAHAPLRSAHFSVLRPLKCGDGRRFACLVSFVYFPLLLVIRFNEKQSVHLFISYS